MKCSQDVDAYRAAREEELQELKDYANTLAKELRTKYFAQAKEIIVSTPRKCWWSRREMHVGWSAAYFRWIILLSSGDIVIEECTYNMGRRYVRLQDVNDLQKITISRIRDALDSIKNSMERSNTMNSNLL